MDQLLFILSKRNDENHVNPSSSPTNRNDHNEVSFLSDVSEYRGNRSVVTTRSGKRNSKSPPTTRNNKHQHMPKYVSPFVTNANKIAKERSKDAVSKLRAQKDAYRRDHVVNTTNEVFKVRTFMNIHE